MTGLTVGVVGASARAAVGSLLRAGFGAWAIDLFADRDLVRCVPAIRCPLDRYPEALPQLCTAFPPGPVLYTGGLENAPAVVAELARQRPLWGNGPDVLALARSPSHIQTILAPCGPLPALIPPDGVAPLTGRWLRKSRGGSGGFGIRPAQPGEMPTPTHDIQELIDGLSMSAQFVSDENTTTLLGVMDQLIAERWLHAAPFRYCGNLGPVVVTDLLHAHLCRFGSRLAAETGLRGVWGMDFILRDDVPFPVEVNPRYTSAIEVLEHATGMPVLNAHADCFRASREITCRVVSCGGTFPTCRCVTIFGAWPVFDTHDSGTLKTCRHTEARDRDVISQPVLSTLTAPNRDRRPARGGVVGKAIYYAPHRIVFPHDGPWCGDLDTASGPWQLPGFADIPPIGERIEAGSPVLTYFAAGSTIEACRVILKEIAADLDRLFPEDHSP